MIKKHNHLFRFILAATCAVLAAALLISAKPYTPVRDDNVFSHHKNSQKKIALTFDDGPHPVYTAQILDLLAEYNIKATFFLVGDNVQKYPNLVLREENEGHELGNHTLTHPKIAKLTTQALQLEILKNERVIYELTDERTKLFRPPEGLCTQRISNLASSLDYTIILWNIDTLDWAHNKSEEIISLVTNKIQPGDILLFHDYIVGESPTIDALKIIIPSLLKEGYQFVTVSELIRSN